MGQCFSGIKHETPRPIPASTIRVVANDLGLDPFIAVDDFEVSYPALFIDHPHRGFESATYIFPEQTSNSVPHLLYYDSTQGQKEFRLGPGGLVRMITGSGISHCEAVDGKKDQIRALNIWFNYPAAERLCTPYSAFYNMNTAAMPTVHLKLDGSHSDESNSSARTRAIILQGAIGSQSGHCFDSSPTPIEWIHYTVAPGGQVIQQIPTSWNALFYVISGKGTLEKKQVAEHDPNKLLDTQMTKMSAKIANDKSPASVSIACDGECEKGVITKCVLHNAKEETIPLDIIYIAAKPVGDPTIVFDIAPDGSSGTFVMSSEEEIKQSLRDWINGTNGFEYKSTWRSPWADGVGDMRKAMSRPAIPAQDRTKKPLTSQHIRGQSIQQLQKIALGKKAKLLLKSQRNVTILQDSKRFLSSSRRRMSDEDDTGLQEVSINIA
eukprot:g1968.t1